jgi:PPK2 family polyphosphate:nucleotide phosphotransferase
MKTKLKKIAPFAHRYRIKEGSDFRLKDIDPGDTWKFKEGNAAKDLLASGVKLMSDMQEKLYAQDRWSLLLIFQAMDAAGKDGTIKHVMSGVNPQGCDVHSFKLPSPVELSHDYLWRANLALPERGKIGIFNRSYYEEVLVVRVHQEALQAEKIPARLVTKDIWKERFEDINAYERHLSRNGLVIRKFFLHLSRAEQKRRFLARLDESAKTWKFSGSDLKERAYWGEYMEAYEDAIRHTTTKEAPWYVVPADNKWFTRLVVSAVINETLASLGLSFPKVTSAQQEILDHARKVLTE